MNQNEKRQWATPEFWLVVIMLGALTLLVYIVLHVGVGAADSADLRASDILEYRKSILTIIITAFGAWVGAGAAYFFGRENLRVAAESLLAMRNQSPAERLRHLPIRNIPQRAINWTVKTSDAIGSFYKTLNKRDRWFIPVVDDNGCLEDVLHEDAVWRFIDNQGTGGVIYADLLKKTVADVISFIQKNAEFKDLSHIYVPVKLDDSTGDVHSQMSSKDVYIGIISDEKGKPTNFVTTADIRIALLQLP
jgi:hypothetical protein